MAHFLTPAKIAALLLIQLYSEQVVPTSVVPHILELIAELVLSTSGDGQQRIRDEYELFMSVLLSVSKIGLSDGCESKLHRVFLQRLWKIDSLDKLDSFISWFPNLLAPDREVLLKEREMGLTISHDGWIAKTSPIGSYIRRCALEYVRLHYHDCTTLWTEFAACQQRAKMLHDERAPDQHTSFVQPETLSNIETSSPQLRTTYEMTKLLEFQVAEMQSSGARLPLQMRTILRDLLMRNSSTPKSSHYLQFLDSWRTGNYNGALEYLHQYFDYNMQIQDRHYYQYALLNLAILQADFGCFDEAQAAMEEALSTARENRDTVCLSYCLSWLQHFGRVFPTRSALLEAHGTTSDTKESLHFLKHRARESEMWNLLSTSCLSEAKSALLHGDSVATVFEHIAQAVAVNTTKDIAISPGPALLMRGTAFSRLGQGHMAQACNHRLLINSAAASSLEDTLKSSVRQSSILVARGQWDEAFSLLLSLDPRIIDVAKYKNHRDLHLHLLHIRRALHHHDPHSASRELDKIQHHCLVGSDTDTDIKIAIHLLKVDLLMKKHALTDAMTELRSLADRYPRECEDVALRCKLQVMVCQIFQKAGQVHRGFSIVIRALDSAYRAQALHVLFEAVVCLAQILTESEQFTAARALCKAVLPGVLENQDCSLTGRLYLVYGDACTGMTNPAHPSALQPKADPSDTASRTEDITRENVLAEATEQFQKALEEFRRAEERDKQAEVLERLGRLYLYRGDTQSAIEAGRQWAEIKTSGS